MSIRYGKESDLSLDVKKISHHFWQERQFKK